MRNKIKELMNKEDGFTLVELLAVIVILAIIVAIAVPTIGNVIGDSQAKADKAEKELVIDAARLYTIENHVEMKDKVEYISTDELQTAGFLDVKETTKKAYVTITATDKGGYTYEYTVGTKP